MYTGQGFEGVDAHVTTREQQSRLKGNGLQFTLVSVFLLLFLSLVVVAVVAVDPSLQVSPGRQGVRQRQRPVKPTDTVQVRTFVPGITQNVSACLVGLVQTFVVHKDLNDAFCDHRPDNVKKPLRDFVLLFAVNRHAATSIGHRQHQNVPRDMRSQPQPGTFSYHGVVFGTRRHRGGQSAKQDFHQPGRVDVDLVGWQGIAPVLPTAFVVLKQAGTKRTPCLFHRMGQWLYHTPSTVASVLHNGHARVGVGAVLVQKVFNAFPSLGGD
jgi:hypothetical protein